jgi:MoaA/NifB/PqqE/SkfB family radical SAM enzyme
MERRESFKDRGFYYSASKITDLLSSISEEKFVQMTQWGEKLTRDPVVKRAIKKVRYFLQREDHPARELFHRVMTRLSEENRRRIFHSLFLHAWFVGGRKRDYWEEKHGFRPPFILILSPTWRCNLRCRGCYTLGYGMNAELPMDLADKVLNECEELGIYFVTILGGEPLVYPHLFALIESHPDIFFQVYTNGTLLTQEKAERMADLGNVAAVLSIEGHEEETDSWRGHGVYKKIMRAFEHLNRAGLIIGTSATVTRQNVDVVSSEEFIDRMIGLGSVAQMYFLYIPVNGKADFTLMVTPEQRDLLRRQVLTFRNSKPIFVLDFWNDGPYVDGCIAAGRKYLHINARGDVEPCVYTHIAVDNIRDTSLVQALNSKLFRDIRSRQPHNPNHLRPCMIIDNPHVMRDVIQKNAPAFTHPGAEEIYTERSDDMDRYAQAYGLLAEKIWAEEYGGVSPVGQNAGFEWYKNQEGVEAGQHWQSH